MSLEILAPRLMTAALFLFLTSSSVLADDTTVRETAGAKVVRLRHGLARRSSLTARECAGAPYGGLAAQAAASVDVDAIYVESGDTFVPPYGTPEKKAESARWIRKAAYVAEALEKLRVRFVVPGSRDLWLGRPELATIEKKFPLISASLIYRGKAAFPAFQNVETAAGTWCFVGLTQTTGATLPKGWSASAQEKALASGLANCTVPAKIVVSDLNRAEIVDLALAHPEVRLWVGGFRRFGHQPLEDVLSNGAFVVSGEEFVERWAELEMQRFPPPNGTWKIDGLEPVSFDGPTEPMTYRRLTLSAAEKTPAWASDLIARWNAEWDKARYARER